MLVMPACPTVEQICMKFDVAELIFNTVFYFYVLKCFV